MDEYSKLKSDGGEEDFFYRTSKYNFTTQRTRTQSRAGHYFYAEKDLESDARRESTIQLVDVERSSAWFVESSVVGEGDGDDDDDGQWLSVVQNTWTFPGRQQRTVKSHTRAPLPMGSHLAN